ncbi:C39 family peptidase [Patescibacteria group bacterium]|nr:C39 family peptidase [Patescibacteria group bacterium]MBU4512465.1 C39 family peptidase [Patescibacteria group bacterium]MCG2692593.1 C39 family peptidase [Candidatus Parcubacteria bacterium]
MRYLLILFIILSFAGCKKQVADFNDSFNVIEKNLALVNKYNKVKEEIGAIREKIEDYNKELLEEGDMEIEESIPQATSTPAPAEELIIPDTFDLPVKFAPQSPFAVWDDLHNEACEEAAMIIAEKYLKNENLDKQIMEDEIQELIKWEEEQGYTIDVTAAETVEILEDYFGLKAEVTNEVTVERIKQELVLGKIVITPHAGRQLGNPYYRQPGPVYHFLIIRGWIGDEFITNDPGTKRGEGYKYKFEKLIETVHDWNGGEVEAGERVMVIVYR